MNPENGAHNSMPIFNVPIPEEQTNFVNGQPQSKSLLIVTSEGTFAMASANTRAH